ncbi:unnamed protein product [Closterium sp. Yama58-4]|nr:unnamed protein product [Closterium sp. Yama58-4]
MPLFQPFRAIGYITDDTPFSVRRVGTETYVTVSVGRAWQIYNCAKLRLVFVGTELPKSIRALTSHRDRTFAAFGTDIAVFYRSHQVGTFKGHKAKIKLLLGFGEYLISVDRHKESPLYLLSYCSPHQVGTLKGHKAKIKLLLVFGEYLLSVDEHRHVLLWLVRGAQRDAPKGEGEKGKGKEGREEREENEEEEEGRGGRDGLEGGRGGNEEGKKPVGADQGGFVLEPLGQFQLPEGFNPTGVIHPDTYLNKVLFASEDGRMQLWNVNSRKLLYEFKGWAVGITALVGSPALDTVAVGCSDGKVHVHNIRLDKPVVDFTHAAAGAVTSLAFNSVAVGCSDGKVHVHNIRLDKPVVDFTHAAAGAVTSLAFNSVHNIRLDKPVVDFTHAAAGAVTSLAFNSVGCSDGKVHVHNLRLDKPVVDFTHAAAGAVTSLAFNSDGQPLLAVGGMGGAISVWDLTNRRLHSIIPDAHDGRVAALSFLVNEPLLLSAGADNSLKIWIFDSVDDNPRLLRYRTGHSSPPCCIKYYRNGRHILSAGLDRSFRIFSTVQDQQSRELSQGNFEKRMKRAMMKEEKLKLSKVVCIDAAEVRERDWANVVTCHENPAAFVWELRNFVIGKLKLVPPGIEPSPATACAASMCGNFALVGTSAGHLHLFHLQSARHRVAYQTEKMQYSPAHAGMVTGAAIDALNRHSVSCGRDGRVKTEKMQYSPAHGGMVTGAAIDALNRHSISCGRDRHIKVRETVRAQLGSRAESVAYQSEKIKYSPAHGGMVTGAAIDALNMHSISCRREGHVKVRERGHLQAAEQRVWRTNTASAAAGMGMSRCERTPASSSADNVAHQSEGASRDGFIIYMLHPRARPSPLAPNPFPLAPNPFPSPPTPSPLAPNPFPLAPNPFPLAPNPFPLAPNPSPSPPTPSPSPPTPSPLAPNPFPLAPNPFPLAPNPFPLAPNPFPLAPNPFPLAPNPFPLAPNPFPPRPQPLPPSPPTPSPLAPNPFPLAPNPFPPRPQPLPPRPQPLPPRPQPLPPRPQPLPPRPQPLPPRPFPLPFFPYQSAVFFPPPLPPGLVSGN